MPEMRYRQPIRFRFRISGGRGNLGNKAYEDKKSAAFSGAAFKFPSFFAAGAVVPLPVFIFPSLLSPDRKTKNVIV
ncbi:MAG: hypothetical protein C6P37_15135 [Caldibacillus debilis]|jgi:hypothetical protein|uniref:Uncharacterized protein n=2 Tax=Caldibacillus debilis TaxID=301148 RepID=A0A3E0JYQ5_9BACI|nr:MAG: hypothetical protein C6P37_15135 [Caldibacillus debilis]REJ27139.1 MAG: hypothetical protein C6W56_11085 [Caldibacillus debilis]